MKMNYVAPAIRLIELDTEEGILDSSNFIDITDKPITDPATQQKDMWGNEDIWE